MFGIGTSGVLVNQFNQVLLIQRDDTRTWAPPGGALDLRELPPDGVAREVKEETGLIVMAVRLTTVHFIPFQPTPLIGFTFRCIQRGGELQTSSESPQVGFFAANTLPRAMAGFHKNRLERAFKHSKAYPEWYVQPLTWRTKIARQLLLKLVYPWKDWQRKRKGKRPYQPPPTWETSAFTIIQNETGAILWVKRTDQDVWNLPGGRAMAHEPPWKTAVRETKEETGLAVELQNLTGVYIYQSDTPHAVFVFTAQIVTGQLTKGSESADFAYFDIGDEPINSVAQHIERVADALSPIEGTVFKHQEGPHLVIKDKATS